MSARETGLMALLLSAETSRAEKALRSIVALFHDNDRMSEHELRVLEITLEGLGVPAARRRYEFEAAVQRKRDRWMLRNAAQEGASDAPP